MANITLGQLRDLWKNVSDWVTGVAAHEPKVQLSGSNEHETVVVQRTGPLAAQTQEVLIDLPGVPCHLEALAMTTVYRNMRVVITPYNADGTLGLWMGIPVAEGTAIGNVQPYTLQGSWNGENDFFKNFVYDEERGFYALGMKRQAVYNSGVKIVVHNIDATSAHDVAIMAMISKWK